MSKHSEIQIADNENYNLKFEIHFYISYTGIVLFLSYCLCVIISLVIAHAQYSKKIDG